MSKAIELAKSISRIDTFTEFQRMEVLEAANELRRLAAVEQELEQRAELAEQELIGAIEERDHLRPLLTKAKALEQELADLKAAMGEPVAWMSPGKERLEFSRMDTVYGSHTIPLYAKARP